MALGLSLKLNNQVVDSYESVTRIFNEYFTLNWEFDIVDKVSVDSSTGISTGIENYSQSGYEIIISTSSVNIGTDSFIGDVTRTGFISSQEFFWEYSGIFIERGVTYYGQIISTDEIGEQSEWKTFSFLYNNLPYVDNVSILPLLPSATDNLQLNYDFFDNDDDLESGTIIRWFKNGSYQKQFDNITLIRSDFLQVNDIWNADIYPSDSYEFGLRITSPQVKVTSTAIVVSNIKVLPKNPNPNDILKVDYVTSDDFEHENVLIRWYINDKINRDFNDEQYMRGTIQEGDIVRAEVKHSNSGTYSSSASVTIISSEFVVTNITIDGKTDPLDVSTITPTINWQDYVPGGKEVNYVSIKIGTFFEANNIYSTIINEDMNSFTIPANILEKGRDYYISIAESDTQTFSKYTSSHFRVNGSRWEKSVSNSTGWTLETLFVVKTTSSDGNYQVIRINDGSKFAEVRIYNDKIKLISGSQVEYDVNTRVVNVMTVVGKDDDIKIYLNRELVIDGEGILTQISSVKRLELGDDSNSSFEVFYKYFFYTVSGDFSPGISEEYSNLQFHNYMEFEDNEIISLQSYIDGKYIFGLNPNNENESSTIYAIRSGEKFNAITIPRTYAPINRISKSPNNKTVVFAHADGVTIINGYFISSFDNELIFIDENNNLNESFPTENGWELIRNVNYEAAYFNTDGFNINTIE